MPSYLFVETNRFEGDYALSSREVHHANSNRAAAKLIGNTMSKHDANIPKMARSM